MEKYILEETEFTPEIIFDPDKCEFSFKGVSRPEDVIKFYQPAIDWLKEFETYLLTATQEKYKVDSLKVIFYLSYFNSSSSKMLLLILEIIKKIQTDGMDIKVDWIYDENDEQMYDDGMDLSETVDIPFNFQTI
jgi:hypothetical protein